MGILMAVAAGMILMAEIDLLVARKREAGLRATLRAQAADIDEREERMQLMFGRNLITHSLLTDAQKDELLVRLARAEEKAA